MIRHSNSFRFLASSAAALVSSLVLLPTPSRAGVFNYDNTSTSIFTENFDLLGTGTTTTTLTSLPNTGGSPWTIGSIPANTPTTAPLAIGTTVVVSDGSVAVVNPGSKLFNLGTTGATDRAIGSGNTGGDPVIDLAIKNSTGHTLSGITITYDTEFWRGGNAPPAAGEPGFFLYYSVDGNAWTQMSPTTVVFAGATALGVYDGNLNHVTTTTTFATPAPIAAGQNFFVRWHDSNDASESPDPVMGVDNVRFSAFASLTYNLAHTVGAGGPNGTLKISPDNYYLLNGTPANFHNGDLVNFSQEGTAIVDVPVDVEASITASANTGSYTLTGPGKLSSGALVKSGAGTLVLANSNTFASSTLSGGGNVTLQAPNTLANLGTLAIGAGGITLQVEADTTVTTAVSGTGLLTKTGAGALILGTGAGNATGGIVVNAGTLRTANSSALGAAAQSITVANNATLEWTTTNDSFAARILSIGAGGATLSVTPAAQNVAITITGTDVIRGTDPITKIGPGVIRISGVQPQLSSNWTVNGGTLEALTVSNPFGSGSITLNPTGAIVLTGSAALTLPNNVTLNGGALGVRSGSLAAYGTPATTIAVTANSDIWLKSNSTPTGSQSFAIGGILSGLSALTVSGTVPSSTAVGALTLLNSSNTYSGAFNVTSRQTVTSAPLGGFGTTFGTASFNLLGGSIAVSDNGIVDNDVLAYGNAVTVGAPSDAVNPGGATISVNRQALGTFSGSTVKFGTLSIGNQKLTTTGGNGYKVAFAAATLTGAATIDTASADVTVDSLTGGANDVTKVGAGILSILGAGSYTGVTNVGAGTLAIHSTLASSRVSVDAGAIFDVSAAPGYTLGAGQTLSGTGNVNGPVATAAGSTVAGGDATGSGTLTFSSLQVGAGSKFALTRNTVPSDILVTGFNGFSVTGTSTIDIVGAVPALGQSTLITYTGSLQGGGSFTLGSIAPRILASIINTGTTIDLKVTSVDFPIWKGTGGSQWSTATLPTKNWVLNSNNATGTDFIANDHVVFNDLATTQTVDVSVADITVGDILFDSTKNYTLTGSKAIGGTTGLTKQNSGSLTITSTANTFTGNVRILGGAVNATTLANAGVASSLGAGSGLTLGNGGILRYGGAAVTTDRALVLENGGGTVATTTDLGLAGPITGPGDLNLGEGVAGTVRLIGPAANAFTGNVRVSGSTVNFTTIANAGVASSLGAGGTVILGGGGLLRYSGVAGTTDRELVLESGGGTLASATAELGWNGPISGTADLTIGEVATGTIRLAGATGNSYTGKTHVVAGILIANKPGGTIAIPGDLDIDAGATFRYSDNNAQEQIADSATVTVNGTFNDATVLTVGTPETITNLNIGATGNFSSGRNTTGTAKTPFHITGVTTIAAGGVALAQRGGGISSEEWRVNGLLKIDGGSTTVGQESYITVGFGGMTLNNGAVQFNAGPSVVGSTSKGSLVLLNGNVTATGASRFERVNAVGGPFAQIDLGQADRTFTVVNAGDVLTIGAVGATVDIINGGVIKAGAGTLDLGGANAYAGATTITEGKLVLHGSISASSNVEVDSGAVLDVSSVAGGFIVGGTQKLNGAGRVLGTVHIDGAVAPGAANSIDDLRTLTFNSAVTFGPTGSAEFEISKDGALRTSDKLTLEPGAGTLTYDGTLHVTLFGTTNLALNDSFTLFSADSYAGNFAAFDLPALPNGLDWVTDKLAVNGTLSVIPEPGSCALVLGGLGLVTFSRRRRKQALTSR